MLDDPLVPSVNPVHELPPVVAVEREPVVPGDPVNSFNNEDKLLDCGYMMGALVEPSKDPQAKTV